MLEKGKITQAIYDFKMDKLIENRKFDLNERYKSRIISSDFQLKLSNLIEQRHTVAKGKAEIQKSAKIHPELEVTAYSTIDHHKTID